MKPAAAPQECWLQSPAPLPAGPPAASPPVPAAVAAHAYAAGQTVRSQGLWPTAFSPLAAVLRI